MASVKITILRPTRAGLKTLDTDEVHEVEADIAAELFMHGAARPYAPGDDAPDDDAPGDDAPGDDALANDGEESASSSKASKKKK